MDLIFFVIIIISILISRIFYIKYFENEVKSKNNKKHVKTLIILGSGGHTTEMLKIIQNLDSSRYTPRVYIHGTTDKISYLKLQNFEQNNNDYFVRSILRSREVGQSYLTSVITTLLALLKALIVIYQESPDLILCNGPGTGLPLCLVAFLLRIVFCSEAKIIFIESFCRIKMSLAPLTIKGFPWDDILNICNDQLHPEIKAHIVPLYKKLHEYLNKNEKPPKDWIEFRLMRIDACLYRIWEDLNTGHWKNVPIQHRYSYTICSILKSIVLELYSGYEGIEKKKKIREVAEQVDKGLLLGAPLENFPNLLTDIASRINEYLSHEDSNLTEILFDDTEDNIPKELLPNCTWVKRYTTPSLETFYREVFALTPAVLEGCMNHWKALTLWKDPNYLIKIAGTRTVPIEIGSSYTKEDWSQQLLTLKDFIQSHVTRASETVGYLAQHQLFEQIPDLKEDFSIPDYCCFGDNADNAPVDINAWFGPKGTISPLHCDPRDNLLCQVFGCKKIILYHPDDRQYLYPYTTRLLFNTAEVDPLAPDYEKFPEFKNAKGFMCYLKSGEMLYIPPGWWHHVVSLSPSFSISFWWN